MKITETKKEINLQQNLGLNPKEEERSLKKFHERTNRINNEVPENIHGGQGRQAMDNLTDRW